MDNAPAHRANDVEDFVSEEKRLELIKLPPYSPDLNPIETVWREVKKETVDPLESIIKSRSTQRKFSVEKIPSREDIEKIIEVGIYAPFPALGTDSLTNPRKFIVIQNGTPEWESLKSIIMKNGKFLYKLARKKKLLLLLNRLTPKRHRVDKRVILELKIYARQIAEHRGHFAFFDTAPYWVVIAEQRHMPIVLTKLARQSMGHCMQNIWLRATDLGMVLQPVSSIYQIQNDKDVCRMLGLEGRNYEMDSFFVGYPIKGLQPTRRKFDLNSDVKWFTKD